MILAIVLCSMVSQQPQSRGGFNQQQFNREVEASLKLFQERVEADHAEVAEIGKLIQGELDRNSDDVETLRQQVNKLRAESQAAKDKPVEHEPVLWPMVGLLLVGIGIFVVYCVRLWADLRLMRLVPGFLREEARPPLPDRSLVSENARHIPDPAYK